MRNANSGPKHKPLSFRGRFREALRLISGRQKTPSYRVNDLARIVDHVVKRTRAERIAGRFSNSYDAGSTQRWREDWSTMTDTPYGEIQGVIGTIRARSRNLFKNDFTYRMAIKTLVNNTVGIGLWPKPRVKNADGTLNVSLNKKIEEHFNIYAHRKEWDARKKSPWIGEGQRMALQTILISGDVLLNAVKSDRGSYLPFSWQMFEADRLDNTIDSFQRYTWQSENVAQTVHGINLDALGRPLSYMIKGVPNPIPAANIIHSFMSDRPEQYIGLPAAISALDAAYDKHDLFEDFVLKSRAISKILWFLSNKNDNVPTSDDKDENDTITLDNMTQMRGEEAPQDVKFPDNVNDTIGPLLKFLMHGICASVGSSYSTVMRDMEGVNFAASQHVSLQEWATYYVIRDFFIDDYCNPFYEKFLQYDVMLGRLPEISLDDYNKNPWKYNSVDWIGKGRQGVNPLQEREADIKAMGVGALTLADVLAKDGKDINDHLIELSTERTKIRELGLDEIIAMQAGAVKAQAAQDAAMPVDEPASVTN